MTSYPPSGDGDKDQGWGAAPQGGAGSGAYGSAGGYPQASGGYPQGGYPQAGAQQGGYQQGAYPQGAYQQGGQQPYYNQPGHPGNYPQPGGSGGPPGDSFFGALFDFSFNRFATPSVIKVLYILTIVVLVLAWLGYTVVFFTIEPLAGVGVLIGGAIVAFLYIIYARVILEFFYAVVRMSEDIHKRG